MPVAKVAFDDKVQQEARVLKTKTALWEGRLNDAIAACWRSLPSRTYLWLPDNLFVDLEYA